ncbi:ankyrin repeat and sterile alpha motif domain-containing protein 1B [Parasteatoda tepidariorum]|nr:ankyrin repeat and sterile alpha motif domain-containing protein 1B [Parasteatoda tepidariorum]
MGKEQELIEAARSGNIATVERYLSQRAKRSGPLASLRRGPGANAQDQSGYTSLHHAALNGHKEIVSLLLQYEASTNVVDHKGSTPLHLAAWTGNIDIVRLLLEQGPSVPNVNLANHDRETPLHSAAQYGHTEVVSLLLKAESGSALHEAALYGKVEVVKLLLDYGIDVNLENNMKRTVFDLLEDLNTAISKQISRIIRDHTTAVGRVEDSSSKSPYSTSPPSSFSSVSTFVPTPEKQNSLLPLVRSGSPMSEATDTICSYNSSKRSSTASDTLRKSQGSSSEHLSMSSRSPSVYETPPLPKDYDAASVHSSSMYEPHIMTSSTDIQGLTTFSPPDPQGPPSRISVPPGWKPLPPAKPPRKSITSLSPSGKTQHHIRQSSVTYDSTSQNPMMYDPSDIMMPRTPPSGFANSDSGSLHHHHQHLAQQHQPASLTSATQQQNVSQQQLSNGKVSETSPFSALYDEVASGRVTSATSSLLGPKAMHRRRLTGEGLRPDKPIPPAKPKTLDLRTKRQTIQIPLSPTHYQQPPTPDFPPPSPSTAALGIHEKIRPLSQEFRNKRISRDIETLTEDELFATIDSGGHIRVSLRKENKSVSTDNIEEIVDDDPFAGLCRGSVCPTSCPCDFQMSLKGQSTKQQQHSYDNMLGMNTLPETRSSRNLRRESPCSDPGGQVSRSTSYDRASISDWGEAPATTESVFVRDMEETFARTLSRLRKEFQRSSFTSSFTTVEEWLKSLDLVIYSKNLMDNGFDDIDFLGGNILEEDDLIEMNITNKEHRQKILESCHSLPALKPISESQAPESVGEWLRSLHLDQYIDTFRRNGYSDMERAKKLWEVELSSVLDITKPGHRKRILTSLGEKPTSRFFEELKDFSLAKMDWTLGSKSGLSTTDEPSSSGDESRTVDIMRGDTSIRSFASNGSLSRTESPPSVSALKIRPPTQLMRDTSPQQILQDLPFNTTQWKHQPDVLVKGSCNYTAKYLGSTLVKEVRGLESTRKSIQKLKSSTRNMNKVPNVILSISYTGVKFIDAQAKKLVCEHEIRNIHCACQDADDYNHFAYITKEHQTANHYCHVFCAQNLDMATEIILTLGQAFEVAYQMAIREKPARSGNKSESGTASCGDDQKRYVSQITVHLVQKTPEKKTMDTELKLAES